MHTKPSRYSRKCALLHTGHSYLLTVAQVKGKLVSDMQNLIMPQRHFFSFFLLSKPDPPADHDKHASHVML